MINESKKKGLSPTKILVVLAVFIMAFAGATVVINGEQTSADGVIDVPTAVTGLTYTGVAQTGVPEGTGYTLSNNTATDAGSYTAIATLESGYTWTGGSTEQKSITWSIGKATQDISYSATAVNKTYGDAAFTNTLTKTKVFGTISYASSDPTVASVDSNGSVTILKSGSTTITATAADGGNNYSSATASYTLTVSKAAGSVTDIQDLSKTYDGNAVSDPTYSSLSSGTATFQYKAGTGSYSSTKPVNAGTYTVKVTVAADDKYNEAYGEKTFTIAKATQDISYSATAVNKTYGDAAFTNTLTETKVFGAISYNSSDSTVASVDSNGSVTILKSGTTTITATAADGGNNYSSATASYTLTIEKKAVTVTASAQTITYGSSIDTSVNKATLADALSGHTLAAVTLTPSRSDYGTGTITPSAATIKNGSTDVTSNYSITYYTGVLTVNKKAVTVTASAQTITYGSSIATTVDNATLAGEVSGHTLTAVTLTPSIDVAGTGVITPSAATIKNGSTDVTSNYSITYNTGVLKINAVSTPIIITADSDSRMYDGEALTDSGYTYTQNVLKAGDVLSATTLGTITDVGTADNTIASYKVMRGSDDVTSCYTFGTSVKGTLEITKRDVTITSDSDSKIYDGTALTKHSVTVTGSGFVSGEDADYSYTGTQTDVGNSENSFTYTLNGSTKAGNYNITQNKGTLTVNAASITGVSITKTYKYDGTSIVPAFADLTITTNGASVTSSDVSITATNNKDAGTATVTVTAASSNFTGSKPCSFTITSRAITLTSASDSKVYDGTALTKQSVAVSGDGLVGSEGFDYNITGSQTNVGSSNNTFTYSAKAGTTASNYSISKVEGTLKVTKATPKASDFTYSGPTDLTYSGTAKEASVTSSKTGMGEITVRYYSDSGLTTVANPINAAQYWVAIDVAAGSNYNEITKLSDSAWTFTIAKATMNEVPAKSFDYTGKTTYILSSFATGTHSETVTLTYTPSSTNANTYKYSGTPSFTLAYSGVQNYVFGTVGDLTINKVKLTPAVDFTSITSKVYDGDTTVDGTPAIKLTGAVNSENPTATATGYALTSKNVGTKAVKATGISLDGTWGTNYELNVTEVTSTNASSLITVKTVAVSSVSWSSSNPTYAKTDYGSTVTASFAGVGSDGTISLTISFLGTSGAATGQTVFMKAGDYTATGTNTDTNYQLSAACTKVYTIKQKDITAEQNPSTVIRKTYDGTTTNTSTVTNYYILKTIEGGDTVTLTADLAYDYKDVLTASNVVVSNLVLGGADAGNYNMTTTSFYIEDAKITPKALTMPAKYTAHDGIALHTVFSLDTGVKISTEASNETVEIEYVASSADAGVYQYATSAAAGKYTVTMTDGTYGGLASNYSIASTGNGDFTIAVAEIGSVGYATIDAAIDAVDGYTTIRLIDDTLTKNVPLTAAKSTNKEFQIELNGRTLDLSKVLTMTGNNGRLELDCTVSGSNVTGTIELEDSSSVFSTSDIISLIDGEGATSVTNLNVVPNIVYGYFAKLDTAIFMNNMSALGTRTVTSAAIDVVDDSYIAGPTVLEPNRTLTVKAGKVIEMYNDDNNTFLFKGNLIMESGSKFYAGLNGHASVSHEVEITFDEDCNINMATDSVIELHGKLNVKGIASAPVNVYMYSDLVMYDTASGWYNIISSGSDPVNISGTAGNGTTKNATYDITGDAKVDGSVMVNDSSSLTVTGTLTLDDNDTISNTSGSSITVGRLVIDGTNTTALDGIDSNSKIIVSEYDGPYECISHITTPNQMYVFNVAGRNETAGTFTTLVLDVLSTESVNSMSKNAQFSEWQSKFLGKYDVDVYIDAAKTIPASFDAVYGTDMEFTYDLSLGPAIDILNYSTELEQTFTVTPRIGLIDEDIKLAVSFDVASTSHDKIYYLNGTTWTEYTGAITIAKTAVSTVQFKTTFYEVGNVTLTAAVTGATSSKAYDSDTATFTVVKGSPVYTAPAAKELVYNGNSQTLVTAGSSDDGTLMYCLTETGTYASDLTSIVGTSAGNYTVYYYVKGDANHIDTAIESVNVIISKAYASVSGVSANTLTYSGSAQALVTAGTSTFGSIEYRLGTGSYGSSVPSATNAGTYEVFYKVDGTSDYYGVAETKVSVEIAKAASSVTAPTAKTDLKYTGSAQVLLNSDGTAIGGTIWYKLGESEYTTGIPSATDAGTYSVYYMVKGDSDHSDLIVASPISVTIAKADVTVSTAPTLKTGLTYTGSALELTTAGSVTGGEILFSVDGSSFTAGVPAKVNYGTYAVSYMVKGDSNHNDKASSSLGNASIAKASSAYTVAPSARTLTYTGEAQELIVAGQTNDGKVVYSFSNNSGFGIAIPTKTDRGTYTVYYKIEGDSNHDDSSVLSVSVTISPKMISADDFQPLDDKTYTGSAITQTVTPVGYLKTSDYATPVFSDNTNAGVAKVTITASASGNYTGSAVLTFNIAKADSSFTVEPTKKDSDYSGSALALANAGTAVGGDILYKIGESGYTKNVPTAIDAGTYYVYYMIKGDSNHNDKIVDSPLTSKINKVAPTVSTAPAAVTGLSYTGSVQAIATAGSYNGGTVMYSLEQNGTYSTEVPSVINAGKYHVYYKVVGDSNHTDIAAADLGEINVAKIDPTYTAPTAKTGLVYNGASQELIYAGTTNGGEMQYSLGTGTYSTAIPTGIAANTYTVHWKIVGGTNYNDFNGNDLTVSIGKTTPVVYAPVPKTGLVYDGTAQDLIYAGSTSEGVMKYCLTETGSYSTAIPTGTNAGDYTVYYKVEGDATREEVKGSVVVNIAKAQAVVTGVTAKSLTFNNALQELVTAGTTNFGTIEYKVDTGSYGTSISTAKDAGDYEVSYRVVGTANYDGVEVTGIKVTIAQKSISSAVATLGTALTYNGASQTQTVSKVTVDNVELTVNTDYTVADNSGKNAGDYTLTIYGKGNYFGTAFKDFSIAKRNMSNVTISISSSYSYDGTVKTVSFTVADGGKIDTTDWYIVSGNTGVNAGSYTLLISATDSGNYIDEKTQTWSIGKAAATYTEPVAKDLTYNGLPQELITSGSTDSGTLKYKLGDGSYSTAIPTATNASTYTVKFMVVGDSNHNDSAECTVSSVAIKQKQISASDFDPIDDQVYTGVQITPTVHPISPLTTDDYTPSYGDNKLVWTGGMVTLTGKDNYVGAATLYFNILKKDLTITVSDSKTFDDSVLSTTTLTASGNVSADTIEGKFTTVSKNAGVYTVKDQDWTVSDLKATQGIDNYNVSYSVSLTILKKALADSMIATSGTYTYNGLEQKVTFTVTDTGLTTDDWVVVSGNAGINAGNYTLVIGATDSGNYSGTASKVWTIGKATATFLAQPVAKDLTYNGLPQELVVAGTTASGTVKYSIDSGAYTTAIPSKIDASTSYSVKAMVVGDSNHNDSAVVTIPCVIKQKPISASDFEEIPDEIYTGSQITPVPVPISPLTTNDYTKTYDTNKNVIDGGKVFITGQKNYTGSATLYFNITKKSLENSMIEMVDKTYTYNKNEQPVEFSVVDGNPSIIAATDWMILSGGSATNAGDYTLVIVATDEGNYSGSANADWTIIKATPVITKAPVAKELTYSGLAQVLVKAGESSGGSVGYCLSLNGTYSTVLPTAINAGTYRVYYMIIGDENYFDVPAETTTKVDVTIEQKLLRTDMVTYTKKYIYNGYDQDVIFSVSDGTAIHESDYSVSGDLKKKDVGDYEFTIDATSVGKNYYGVVHINWQIDPKELDNSMVSITGAYTYTGSNITPTYAVTDGVDLEVDVDFIEWDVTGFNAGEQTLVIAGIGNYTGYASQTWTIAPLSIAGATIDVGEAQTYNGGVITQNIVSVKLEQAVTGFDYDLDVDTYLVTDNMAIDAGTHVLKVFGDGNFTGEQVVDWQILRGTQSISYEKTLVYKIIGCDQFINPLTKTQCYGVVSYYSSDSSVAEVAPNGKVTVHTAGVITITAYAPETTNYTSAEATYKLDVAESKRIVDEPKIESKQYTGTTLTADVPASELYTVVKNEGGINIGSYDVILGLTDPENFKWSTTDDANVTLKFSIVKADQNFHFVFSASRTDYGTTTQYNYLKIDTALYSDITFSSYDESVATVEKIDNLHVKVNIVGAGVVLIRADAPGGDTYNSGSATYTLDVQKRTIDAVYDGESIKCGGNFVGNVTVTGFVRGETAETAEGYVAPFVYNTHTQAGVYSLAPINGEAKNYKFNYIAGNLVITHSLTYHEAGTSDPSFAHYTCDGCGEIFMTLNADSQVTISGNYYEIVKRITLGSVSSKDISDVQYDIGQITKANSKATFGVIFKSKTDSCVLSKGQMDTLLADESIISVGFGTSMTDVTLSVDTIKSMESTGDYGFSATSVSVPSKYSEKFPNATAYELGFTAGTQKITSFGNNVRITLTYYMSYGETADGLVAYYLGDEAVKMSGATYDADKEEITFNVDHFSTYAVTYEKPAEPVTDNTSLYIILAVVVVLAAILVVVYLVIKGGKKE